MDSNNVDLELIGRKLRGDVLVLTGAGISAASGLPTFRGEAGLYEGLNPYELASPQAFAKHPVTVWNWYLMRIHQGKDAAPNDAHLSLVDLEEIAKRVTIVTSNVDPLHERAGSTRVFKLHGDILQTCCTRCRKVEALDPDSLPQKVNEETLFRCECGGILRPNVVWFGEYPNNEATEAALRGVYEADIVLEIGTSGVVNYGFTEMAVQAGKMVIRINPEPTLQPGIYVIADSAEQAVPALVALATAAE
jgi:NAD-dependent deacetylase